MDASVRTTVTVSANAYDQNTSGYGCAPSGCTAENTRDGSTVESSRWSCKYSLDDSVCQITYYFEEPQDIVDLKIALYKGDERTRTIKVKLNGSTDTTIETSGETTDYETWTLNSDETASLTLEASGLGRNGWLSITEVLCHWCDKNSIRKWVWRHRNH